MIPNNCIVILMLAMGAVFSACEKDKDINDNDGNHNHNNTYYGHATLSVRFIPSGRTVQL